MLRIFVLDANAERGRGSGETALLGTIWPWPQSELQTNNDSSAEFYTALYMSQRRRVSIRNQKMPSHWNVKLIDRTPVSCKVYNAPEPWVHKPRAMVSPKSQSTWAVQQGGDGQINEDGGQLLGAITGPTLSPRHAAAHERRSYVLFAVGLPLLVPTSPSVGQPQSSLMIWGFGAQSDPNSVHGKVGLGGQWLAPGSSSTSSWRS
ncbi:hypothetical protein MHUMG1_03135 [Metarhizium humberi]|uniref:Uncharacterized protein n=1 Tax=Metarhizium humberi TaxID=2596975 RepID=A0A9P8MCL8_9HYPO|nr:hypothetical protein MHUMG1_03135 [Metarhizium humberi]